MNENVTLDPIPQELDEQAAENFDCDSLNVMELMRSHYGRAGFRPPWIGYFVKVDGRIVGTCAYKTAPHT